MKNIFKLNIYSHSPRHWIKNVIQFFRNIKYAFQRATRGFSDPDWWELDTFISIIIRDGCAEMSKKHYGSPLLCENIEESSDKWEEILNEISEHFNNYINADSIDISPEDEKYLELLQKAHEDGEKEYVKGIYMLKEWHWDLWD